MVVISACRLKNNIGDDVRGSNPRPPACKAGALPLSYTPVIGRSELQYNSEPPIGFLDADILENHNISMKVIHWLNNCS